MTRSQHAARLLLDARRPGSALTALPDHIIPTNKNEAYLIQAELVDMLSLQSGRPAGYLQTDLPRWITWLSEFEVRPYAFSYR